MVTMNGDEPTAILPSGPTTLDQSIDDDDDDGMSDGSSGGFEDAHDLMTATMEDEVTAQLAAAGPVGMAAAAAIASAKKRKRPHQFETNPSIRKRQQTRLLRKLRQTIDEFTIRVGMQAIVLVAIPGKPQNSFKCFGAKPLEDVVRSLKPTVLHDLEAALAAHAPAPAPEDPSLHELPPLVIDGIPTPVEKMTQAQLRAFIPLMLKFSTGRGKPGWGKESTRPPWWPSDLPWANVRMDARTEDEKQKVSWTHALRQIVINCYKFHGREDLLPVFSGEPDDGTEVETKPPVAKMAKASISHITTNTTNAVSTSSQSHSQTIATQALPFGAYSTQLAQIGGTVYQTISNSDGTVSLIPMDAGNSIITLPDGTTAQLQGVATLQHSSDGTPNVQTVQVEGSDVPMTVDLNSVTQAALGQDGQIIITGEDGHTYPVTVSGMITVPVPQQMYQTVVANISQIQATQNADGSIQRKAAYPNKKPIGSRVLKTNKQPSYYYSDDVVTPMQVPKVEPGEEATTTSIPLSAITGDPSHTQLLGVNANGQVVHNDKVYQLVEYVKPDSQEKVIMMTQLSHSDSENNEVQIERTTGTTNGVRDRESKNQRVDS